MNEDKEKDKSPAVSQFTLAELYKMQAAHLNMILDIAVKSSQQVKIDPDTGLARRQLELTNFYILLIQDIGKMCIMATELMKTVGMMESGRLGDYQDPNKGNIPQ